MTEVVRTAEVALVGVEHLEAVALGNWDCSCDLVVVEREVERPSQVLTVLEGLVDLVEDGSYRRVAFAVRVKRHVHDAAWVFVSIVAHNGAVQDEDYADDRVVQVVAVRDVEVELRRRARVAVVDRLIHAYLVGVAILDCSLVEVEEVQRRVVVDLIVVAVLRVPNEVEVDHSKLLAHRFVDGHQVLDPEVRQVVGLDVRFAVMRVWI